MYCRPTPRTIECFDGGGRVQVEVPLYDATELVASSRGWYVLVEGEERGSTAPNITVANNALKKASMPSNAFIHNLHIRARCLREGRVVGPCWEKLKPEGPKGNPCIGSTRQSGHTAGYTKIFGG